MGIIVLTAWAVKRIENPEKIQRLEMEIEYWTDLTNRYSNANYHCEEQLRNSIERRLETF